VDIYIFRHGNAFPVSDEHNEENRPLTNEGHNETNNIGKYLLKNQINFDIVWVSPYERALQTKDNIFKYLNNNNEEILSELKPNESPDFILHKIESEYNTSKVIGIVGHQPQIEKLISKILNTKPIFFDVKPATLIQFNVSKSKNNKIEYKLVTFIQSRNV
jgi:phosphohistidine phosphatase